MSYIILLNNLSFTEANTNDRNLIREVLTKLASLMGDLKRINYEIILNSGFPDISIANEKIIKIIYSLADEETKAVLLSKIRYKIYEPFSSDGYNKYLEKGLPHDDYYIENYDKSYDIFGTFFAVALYTNSPILSADLICNIEIFKEEFIFIISDNDKRIEIRNFKLSQENEEIIAILNEIDNWYAWFDSIEQSEFVKITDDCKEEIIEKFSFNAPFGKKIKTHIRTIRDYMRKIKTGAIKIPNYKKMGIDASPESESTRKNKKLMKERKANDCSGKRITADWHSKLGDYRLYFIPYDNFICICKFTLHLPI